MSRVAVVLCTYLHERSYQVQEAIASLRGQTRAPDEVVLVVDGNGPLAERLDGLLSGVRIVALPRRSGLAAARNAGVDACSSETVLFLDDDAVAEPEWVERLGDAIESPQVLGASGSSVPIWHSPQPRWLPDEFLWTVGCSYLGQPPERTEVRNVYGGCCGLKRQIFTEVGGYDTEFGRSPTSAGGGEEAELCLRATRHWPGFLFVYDPTARIRHHVPNDRLTLRYVLRRAYDEGKMKAGIALRHRGGLGPEVRFASVLPLALVRYLRLGLTGNATGVFKLLGCVLISAAVIAGMLDKRTRITYARET